MLIFCDNKHVLTLHVGQGRKVPWEAGGGEFCVTGCQG